MNSCGILFSWPGPCQASGINPKGLCVLSFGTTFTEVPLTMMTTGSPMKHDTRVAAWQSQGWSPSGEKEFGCKSRSGDYDPRSLTLSLAHLDCCTAQAARWRIFRVDFSLAPLPAWLGFFLGLFDNPPDCRASMMIKTAKYRVISRLLA